MYSTFVFLKYKEMSKYFILFETGILLDLIYMVYTQWDVLIAEFLYLETFSQPLTVLGAQDAQLRTTIG